MQLVPTTKAKAELNQRIRKVWLKGTLDPVYFPGEPGEVDDDAGTPKVAVVHYDAARAGADDPAPPDLVRNIFDHKGGAGGYRDYKNNVLFLVADEDQVDALVENARRYLALRRIVADAERLAEFKRTGQDKRLRELADDAQLKVRVAITRAYKYLHYPSADAPQRYSNLARETLPAQDQGEVDRDQTQVLLGVLRTTLDKSITAESKPLPAAWLKSKVWPQGRESVSPEELRRVFARRLGLRILLDLHKLKTAIKDGCKQGSWVYFHPQEQLGYGKPSPAPFVQIGDDPVLYTPDEAARLEVPIKGDKPPQTCPVCDNPVDDCICDQVCIRCGSDPCTCDKEVVLHGEGAPGQAFVSLLPPSQRRHRGAVDPDASTFARQVDAVHTAMLVHDEDGSPACTAFLDRTGLGRDGTFRACLRALLHAVPRTKAKGEFVRPEAATLEGLRLAFFDDIEPPTDEEPPPVPAKQIDLLDCGAGEAQDEGEEDEG